jgi:hypothetical protein
LEFLLPESKVSSAVADVVHSVRTRRKERQENLIIRRPVLEASVMTMTEEEDTGGWTLVCGRR